MLWALVIGLVAWSLVYASCFASRIRLGLLDARVQALMDARA